MFRKVLEIIIDHNTTKSLYCTKDRIEFGNRLLLKYDNVDDYFDLLNEIDDLYLIKFLKNTDNTRNIIMVIFYY